MKFGFSGANLSTNVDNYDEVVSVVKYGEDLGYDSAWISDRIRDAYVTLTLCAKATNRIRLCTGALSSYSRNPLANARSFATLDELCGGRQAMTIGVGNVEAARQLGYSSSGGAERVKEMCIITRKLFLGESVTFEGNHFRLKNAKLDMKSRKDIEIYIAGSGPKIMKVAGEVADGAILPYANPDVISKAKRSIRAGAEIAGRKLDTINLVSWLPTYITNEKEKVLDSLRGFAAMQFVLTPFEWLEAMGVSEQKYLSLKEKFSKRALVDVDLQSEFWKSAHENISNDIVELLSLVGNAQQVVSKLEELERSGFSEFSLWIPVPTLVEKRKVLETFAMDVASVFY